VTYGASDNRFAAFEIVLTQRGRGRWKWSVRGSDGRAPALPLGRTGSLGRRSRAPGERRLPDHSRACGRNGRSFDFQNIECFRRTGRKRSSSSNRKGGVLCPRLPSILQIRIGSLDRRDRDQHRPISIGDARSGWPFGRDAKGQVDAGLLANRLREGGRAQSCDNRGR
jgi:hypothetical protein